VAAAKNANGVAAHDQRGITPIGPEKMPIRAAATATTVAAKNTNGVIVLDRCGQRDRIPTGPEKRAIRTTATATTGAGNAMA
jgi:hypothetical protein